MTSPSLPSQSDLACSRDGDAQAPLTGAGTHISPSRPSSTTSPSQAPVLNIANALTLLRLLLVPVFIWLMLSAGEGMRLAATLVFVIASVTDRLDGQLARSRGLVTNVGKIADPIADKVLTLSAFILLSVAGRLWWWVSFIILVRELGITLMRMVVLRRAVIAASRGGKLKTVLQIGGLFFLLMPWSFFLPAIGAKVCEYVAYGIIGAALVVTVVTGIDYVRQAWRLPAAEADTAAAISVGESSSEEK